jgi:tetratricopeptide (TPR) repeat protein
MMYKSAKAYALISVIAVLLYGGGMLLPEAGGDAVAQDKKEKKKDSKAPMEGRKTESLSKRVYELITEANEKVDVEDYAGAVVLLDKVKAMPKLSTYETAQLYTFYGFLYFNAEQYDKAIKAYNTVLAQPELPPAIFQQTIRTLSQLAFVTEDYQLAIKYANQYMDTVGPEPDMYVIIGTAHYQMVSEKNNATAADYDKVIKPVEKAIALANERGTSVKEQWWLLLRVGYWEQDNFSKVRDILEILVINWPKKEYWTQLSGMYGELKDERKQLAAYEAAYDQGLLTKSAELVQMAQLFMQADVPYKGARVLEKGFKAEIIERKVRNLRLQSQAWQLAREDRKAIPPLKEAAGLSDDGELFSRLAQSHLNLSEYKSCITASGKAIKKGDLKNKGNTYLIQGMCQFELDKLADAKASFRQAVKHEKVAKNARSWIDFVESEESRLQQLERSMRMVEESYQAI